MASRFNADEDEILTEAVSCNSCVWDMRSSAFKNVLKKDLIWSAVGEKINIMFTY